MSNSEFFRLQDRLDGVAEESFSEVYQDLTGETIPPTGITREHVERVIPDWWPDAEPTEADLYDFGVWQDTTLSETLGAHGRTPKRGLT